MDDVIKPTIKSTALTFSIARLTGGLYFSVQQLHQSLLSQNVLTDMITLEGGWGERLSQEELDCWKPLDLHVFPCWWPHKFGYSPKLLPAIKQSAPEIIHCHGVWHYHLLACSRYCRQHRIPWMVSTHGMLDDWAMRNKAWKKRVASWLYQDTILRQAACIRALCPAEAEAIRRRGCRNPICIIPNGVELPEERKSLGIRPQCESCPTRKKVLLFLGRIAPKKGLVNLIRAWKQARVKNAKAADDWVLVIAGEDEGGHEAELKRCVKELELGQSVLFIGPQYGHAKTSLLFAASAFILPSYSEGLPMGVLDAWAHRLPVLMTSECNLPEGFAVGAAIRIEVKPAIMAGGLSELFQTPSAALQSLGENGRNLVARKFNWHTVVADMRSVYEWLLGGGQRPELVRIHEGLDRRWLFQTGKPNMKKSFTGQGRRPKAEGQRLKSRNAEMLK